LAAKAKTISEEEADSRRQKFSCSFPDDFPAAFHLLEIRGWAESSELGAYGSSSPAFYPTSAGIDHAHHLMRPWYKRMWDYFEGDIRAIVVAAMTAIVITVITNLILD